VAQSRREQTESFLNSEVTKYSYAGRLKLFASSWKSITSDPYILSIISGYKIVFRQTPRQVACAHRISHCPENLQIIDNLIERLTTIGAIENVEPCKNQFISSVFIVPKSDGTHRLVLNLRDLNNFVENSHFQMEDARTATNLLTSDCYMCTLDLKDAFHLIPIHPSSRKYLRFYWRDKLYQYTCLPFGLCSAPRIFTKVIRPILGHLRSRGLKSVGYLDDFLLLGDNFDACTENYKVTKILFESLGFLINESKSQAIPVTRILYLGLLFDSKSMSVYLPDHKVIKIRRLVRQALKYKKMSVLSLSQLVGNLVAACPAVRYGQMYIKRLEFDKIVGLRHSNGNYEHQLTLSSESCEDLRWWLNHDYTLGCKIKADRYNIEIYSDASLTGWGAHLGIHIAKGHWNINEKLHINVLELMAVYNALRSFDIPVNSSVLLRLDSSTAIAYINKQGGCRSTQCSAVAKKIWLWCEQRNVWLFATYINTKKNFVADYLSRNCMDSSDYKLSNEAFSVLCSTFGSPNIDLFASDQTAQCEKFVSWLPSPNCYQVDAFSFKWKDGFYAFPPFCLIPRVLRKIRLDGANGIVIVPDWPTQSWYPEFLSMVTRKVIRLGPSNNLLYSPYYREPLSICKSLVLLAAVLSGNT